MILTTCKYFDLVGNRCSRVTDGKCNDLQDCEFKYIAELKAENERLKEEIKEVKKYQYEQEYLEKEIEEMQKALKTLAEGLNKRQILLQEIKAIAETGMHCEGMGCDFMPKILDLITKTEEE